MFKCKHSHLKTGIFSFWGGGQRQQGAFSDCFSDNYLLFSHIYGVQVCAEAPRLALNESVLAGLIFVVGLIACDLE